MIRLTKTAIMVLAIAVTASAQIAKPIARAVNSPGVASATPSGWSYAPVISSDGRYVAFSSSAKDLVLNQSNTLFMDVFLRDVDGGTTVRTCVATNGASAANGNSSCPVISGDGRFISFISGASNLTSQAGNSYPQLLVRDTVSNTTEMASVSSSGVPVSGGIADFDMTPDGRYLVFAASFQVLLRDRQTHTTSLITFNATNPTAQSTGRAATVSMSTNGQRVVYLSTASDLIVWPGSPPTRAQPYLFDAVANSNMCLSLDAQQVLGGIPSIVSNVVISADGSAIAFGAFNYSNFLVYESLTTRVPQIVASNLDVSAAPELTADGTQLLYRHAGNGTDTIYLWNAQTALTQTINVAIDGSVNGNAYPCGMSADGSRVVFVSNATNLTADVANGLYQIYVRDTIAATTRLVSVTSSGPAPTSQRHSYPSISADGSRVVFASADDSFVANDNNRNVDVFVWSWATGQVQPVSARDVSTVSLTDSTSIVPSSYSVSSNGGIIAFAAGDGNLLSGDRNGVVDVLLRNTLTNQTVLGSPDANGNFGTNGPCAYPAMSADGRFVAYIRSGTAFGLASGDVVLQDMQTGAAKLITTNYSGVPIGNANNQSISSDGRYVAFQTASAVAGSDGNGRTDVYLYDSVTGTNSLISYPGTAFSPFYDSSNAVFSPDGNWLAFQSSSPYLSGSNLKTTNVLLYMRHIGSNVNVLVSGTPLFPFTNNCSNAVFSADSQVLAFNTGFNGLPALATHNFSNNSNQFVVYNAINPSINRDGTKIAYNVQKGSSNQIYVQTIGSTASNLVSVAYNGTSLANSNCSAPILTADGRFVIFTSTATNLVANDTNGVVDIFVRDLMLSNTFAISGPGSAVPSLGAVNPVVSADGRTIVFQSFSTDFTTNILTANRNLFVAKILVGDSDHDGMDDDWEMTYFGDLSHNGRADTDGDGSTDYQEFLAGTNPIDNNSVLRCLAVATSAGGATVYWSAVPGRAYRIEYKNSIGDASWTTLVTSTTASNQTASVFDPDASLNTQRFYRVIALP